MLLLLVLNIYSYFFFSTIEKKDVFLLDEKLRKESLETRVFFSLSNFDAQPKQKKKEEEEFFIHKTQRESFLRLKRHQEISRERERDNDDFTKLKRVVRDDDAHRELHPPQPVGVEIAIHLVREKGVVFVVLFFSRAQSASERRVVERPRDDGRSRWRHRRERSDRR